MSLLGPYYKQPDEQETIEIDLAARISSFVVASYAIASVSVTVLDSVGADVTGTMLEGVPTYDGTSIFFTIKAGTTGNTYYAKAVTTCTKAGGYSDQLVEEDVEITVTEYGF